MIIWTNSINVKRGFYYERTRGKEQRRGRVEEVFRDISFILQALQRNKNDTTVFDPIRPDTKNTDNDNDNDIKRKIYKKKFQKPSVEEIRDYCQERGDFIDPEQFFDFYEAKGWMIGKESMKDWKAAIRTWKRNRDSSPPEPRNDSGLDEIAARKAAYDKAYEEACAR